MQKWLGAAHNLNFFGSWFNLSWIFFATDLIQALNYSQLRIFSYVTMKYYIYINAVIVLLVFLRCIF